MIDYLGSRHWSPFSERFSKPSYNGDKIMMEIIDRRMHHSEIFECVQVIFIKLLKSSDDVRKSLKQHGLLFEVIISYNLLNTSLKHTYNLLNTPMYVSV